MSIWSKLVFDRNLWKTILRVDWYNNRINLYVKFKNITEMDMPGFAFGATNGYLQRFFLFLPNNLKNQRYPVVALRSSIVRMRLI